jgi:hypothetical protein
VIYSVLHNRADYGRLVLLYGARSPHDLLYASNWPPGPVTTKSRFWSQLIMAN